MTMFVSELGLKTDNLQGVFDARGFLEVPSSSLTYPNMPSNTSPIPAGLSNTNERGVVEPAASASAAFGISRSRIFAGV